MKKASTDFASIRASETKIQATEAQRVASALNALSLTASAGHTRTTTAIHSASRTVTENAQITSAVGVQLAVSMATWFNWRQNELTTETQKVALKALKMQLAMEAADYVFTYNLAVARSIYLRLILSALIDVQKTIDSGNSNISDTNKALLKNQIATIQNSLSETAFTIKVASTNINKFLGSRQDPRPANLFNLNSRSQDSVVPSNSTLRNNLANRSFVFSRNLDNFFRIPRNLEQALRLSSQNPAILISNLEEAMARNTWYLTVASQGPTFVLSFNRSLTNPTLGLNTQSVEASVVTGALSFQFGAGLTHSLRSAELLEKAAQWSRVEKEIQIRTALTQLYETHSFMREQIAKIEKSFQDLLTAVANVNQASFEDGTLKQTLDLLTALDAQGATLAKLTNEIYKNKLQIHAATGDLLNAIEREIQRERQPPARTLR